MNFYCIFFYIALFLFEVKELAISEIEMANNSVLFTNRLVNDNLDKAID